MQNASSAGRKLTNEERVEVVKRQKKRNSFQLAMLSVIGILGFLLLWLGAAVLAGVRQPLRRRLQSYRTIAGWWIQSGRRGTGVPHRLQPPVAALTGFLLAIVIRFSEGFLWAGSGFDKFMQAIFGLRPPCRFPGFR